MTDFHHRSVANRSWGKSVLTQYGHVNCKFVLPNDARPRERSRLALEGRTTHGLIQKSGCISHKDYPVAATVEKV